MRLIAGSAALLLAMCLATSAHAHAVLIGAEPTDGSVQAEAPKMVVLRFNEAVGFGLDFQVDKDPRAAGSLEGKNTMSWGGAAGTAGIQIR